mmetsp:Transcript_27268/g.66167  ORF Transcript_27268/g.66167 Transcript_27268/m.66167 type:complete len:117 (+) Transcript_27268:186-536(+)
MDRCGIMDSSQRWCESLVCPTHRLGGILSSSKWSKESFGGISHSATFLAAIIVLLVYCCVYFQILDFEDEPVGQSYVSPRPGSTSSSNTKNVVGRIDARVRDFNRERTSEKQGKGD